MLPLETISLFPNPNVPDLGCFVRRKHEFERDDDFQNLHVEFNPSIDFSPQYHQCGQSLIVLLSGGRREHRS
jgi:hypothetical protein